jgi:Holliday junction resolvase RusA-like endonuclease
MLNKIIRFNITPQTNVRATQGDSIFFRIPRNKLRDSGLKRLMRLEKYNQYKDDLRDLARQKNFELPSQGLSIHFYIPVPKSWYKTKKARAHGKLHQSKPDIDNLTKAVFDALLPEDKRIAQVSELVKTWVDNETGWIEFKIEKPKYQEFK